MRIFVAARPDPQTAGFTLTELMVVLAVLALAATAVILTMPGGDARVTGEADRLASRIAALRDLAIVEGRPMALVLSPSGYGFERREQGGWGVVSGRGFERRDWPQGVRLAEPADGTAMRIGFDPLGMTSARTAIVLAEGDAAARLTVTTGGEVLRSE
jgi:general secretion pathway protein H